MRGGTATTAGEGIRATAPPRTMIRRRARDRIARRLPEREGVGLDAGRKPQVERPEARLAGRSMRARRAGGLARGLSSTCRPSTFTSTRPPPRRGAEDEVDVFAEVLEPEARAGPGDRSLALDRPAPAEAERVLGNELRQLVLGLLVNSEGRADDALEARVAEVAFRESAGRPVCGLRALPRRAVAAPARRVADGSPLPSPRTRPRRSGRSGRGPAGRRSTRPASTGSPRRPRSQTRGRGRPDT